MCVANIDTSLGVRMKKLLTFLLVLGSVIVFSACQVTPTLTIDEEDQAITLTVGQSVTIDPTVTEGRTLEWATSNAAVATVTAGGSITAVAAGTATITVTITGTEISGTIAVTVVRPDATGVTITGAGNMVIGGTLQLSATVAPAAALQTITWSTSDAAIATVSAAGLVSAVSNGSVTITATSHVSTVKAEVSITITRPNPTGITITGPDAVMINETITLAAVVAPEFASQGVLWSVSSTAIATITTAGVLTGVAGGTVTVTATSLITSTITGTKEITVNLPAPTGVTVSGPDAVAAGETGTYTATVAPVLADQSVTWSTSDVTKATISAAGVLTAVAVGSVDVIATSTVDNTIVGQKTVTIEQAKLNVTFNMNGGQWAITSTDPFVVGDPVLTNPLNGRYNSTAADYYVSATEGAYLNSIFINDANYKMSPSVWQNRAFLNRNAAGFYVVELVVLAGSANANPTLSDYEYALFAHSGYAAGYAFVGALQVGQIITMTGFDMMQQEGFAIVGEINAYAATQAVTTASFSVVEGTALPTPSKGTYPFEGWYTNAEFTGSPVTTATASGTVYAKWGTPMPTELTVEGEEELYVGDEGTYTATILPAAASQEVTWSVSDEEIATISATGVLTTLKAGIITVTATSVADGTIVGELEVVILANELLLDAALSTATAGDQVVFNDTTFIVGTNAFATLAELADKLVDGYVINVKAGTYAGDLLINKNNISILGPNALIDPNTGVRVEEAEFTGVITLGKEISGAKLAGLKFTGQAKVLNTLGTAGISTAPTVNLNGFNFENNIVETELAEGKGFIYFVEASSSYSHNLVFKNNYFTVVAETTKLANMIQIDNNVGLVLEGNVFEDIAANHVPVGEEVQVKMNAFFLYDTTKGLAGNAVVKNNQFINVENNAFRIGWLSPLPETTMLVEIMDNFFDGIGGIAIQIGSMNNTDVLAGVHIQYNVFNVINNGIFLNRVHAGTNAHVNYNDFLAVPTGYYITDNKTAATPVALDAMNNVYQDGGVIITPDAGKFFGTPDYTVGAYTVEFVANDGVINYQTKTEVLEALLTDLYAFVGATEPLSDFMHGVGNTSGFAGLWYSNATYKAKIYDGPRPTGVDDTKNLFVWSSAYQEKWLPFFDLVDALVKEVNATQFFFGAGTWTGFLRLNAYVTNAATPFSAAQLARFPEVENPDPALDFAVGNVPELPVPVKDGFLFGGWFVNSDLSGEALESLDRGPFDNIELYAKWYVETDVVVVTADHADEEVFVVTDLGKFVKGHNAFSTLAEALAVVDEDGMVFVLNGTYADPATVETDGILITGEVDAIITGVINVGASVDGLTIDGLKFTSTGSVVGSTLGTSNFTFQNNHVYDSNANMGVILFWSGAADAIHSNMVIVDNVFDIDVATSIGARYIRGGNINGLVVTGNIFEGIPGQYSDAIRIGGTGAALESATAGPGLHGVVVIDNNEFLNIGQRSIWIRRYSATQIDITNNLFDYAGDATYGGGVQLETWVSGQETEINIKFNTFQNIAGTFGVRLNNTAMLETATWEANVNYNKFINFTWAGASGTNYYVQTYGLADQTPAQKSVDAQYNYYSVAPEAAKFAGLVNYANHFETEVALEEAIDALQQVTVTFDSNEGSEVEDQIIYVNNKALQPADPTRLGYTFGGWFTDDSTFLLAFDFDTLLTEDVALFAKWTLTQYTVTYNYNDGVLEYATKNEMIEAFLTDLYEYVEATESLSDFMHGTGLTSGYDGLWHSNATYKAKIYDGGVKPTEANAEAGFFVSDPAYFEKWMPFFENVEAFIKAVNATQWFFAPTPETTPSTFVGLIRIRQYIINVKPAAYVTDAQMAMMPAYTYAPATFTMNSADITLPTPLREGYVFAGWFGTATFTGDVITTIPTASTANVVLYAKWTPIEYPITYNYNGGELMFADKTEMVDAFLSDLYDYVQPVESLTDFMHGTGLTSGYIGLWYSNAAYAAKVYNGGVRPTEVNSEAGFFITDAAYFEKWMPFFDTMDAFIKSVNATQWFFAPTPETTPSTFVGLLRTRQYISNVKPAAYVTDAQMAMMPAYTVAFPTYTIAKATTLPTPVKEGFEFAGWYDNAEFAGDPIVEIPMGEMGAVELFAKWQEPAEILPASVNVEGVESLTVGQTADFTATVLPAAADQTIVWTVSDTNIATISETGTLTAVAYGTVNVIATAKNGVYKSVAVQVYAVPTGVSYRGPEAFVMTGTGTPYGQVYSASGTTADQTALTYESSDTAILTIDATTGEVTPVAAGTATITITSTIDATKKATKLVTVHPVDITTLDVTTVFVTGSYDDKEAFYSSVVYRTIIVGYNAFPTLQQALDAVAAAGTVYLMEGTYEGAATIAKDDMKITGSNATVTGKITVNANIKNLEINGLTFSGAAAIDMNAGGIEGFTFKNNKVTASTIGANPFIGFKHDGIAAVNKDFVIQNNIFEVKDTPTIPRWIRGGNVVNLTIVGNTFEGVKGQYVDAIRIEGDNESATVGATGAGGIVTISDNEFLNIGQRGIWIRRFSATEINFEHNYVLFNGGSSAGGGLQIEVFVPVDAAATPKVPLVETEITIFGNTFENITHYFAVRLGSASYFDITANVNYNKFLNIDTSTADIVQAYEGVTDVNADYNYFTTAPTADDMPFVNSYANSFATEEELELALILLEADETYGVAVFEEMMESYPNIAYTATAATFGGLDWNIKETYLNPDANDKLSADPSNTRMIRLRGANVAFIELAEFFDGITTLAFDAKYYSASHTTSVMKVSKMVEGGDWVEVATITLTDSYVTQYVAINETGNVKIRIDVTSKSANIDNIRFYQSAAVFTDKFNAALLPQLLGSFNIVTYDTSIWAGGASSLVHLDPNGTGGTFWYKVIFELVEEQYVVTTVIEAAYTFTDTATNYSIHLHTDAAAIYTAIKEIGIAVGDILEFDTDISTLVAGVVNVGVQVFRLPE